MNSHDTTPQDESPDGQDTDGSFIPGAYERTLWRFRDRDFDSRFELGLAAGLRVSWLNQKQAFAVVTALAERSWLLNQHQSSAGLDPWQIEYESWARTALDAMWEQVATGSEPIEMSDCDPEVFTERPATDRTDLMSALSEAFEFTVLRLSAEMASFPILFSQTSFLQRLSVDPLSYRSIWYQGFWDPSKYTEISDLETLGIDDANPLRLAPYSWVERDIDLLSEARDQTSYAGLRDLAANDVRVGLELKHKLDEVVLPSTGPITADVWPTEVCSVVETAIQETMQQSLS